LEEISEEWGRCDVLECDDGASAVSGYDGGDEATSTPETDVAHLPPLPSDSDSDTWLEAAPGTTANVFVGTQESGTLLDDDSQFDVVDSNKISGDEESETTANLAPATVNMENATALAVQSQALEPREDQVGIYLSKT
jgi:hypothetical protein